MAALAAAGVVPNLTVFRPLPGAEDDAPNGELVPTDRVVELMQERNRLLAVHGLLNSRVRGFTAEIQPNQSVHYTIMTDDENYELAIDSGGEDGQLTLYYADPENIHQQWRWFQTDLVMAESDGCAIDYPFPASDLDSYQREIACDRVAQMQPPYNAPAGIVRDASVFPGSVSPDLPRVSQTFAFNLDFKNHDYLRIDQPPANWLNTDLYAPPNAIVRVTLSDDVRGVSVMIGVHTDTLYPDSGNVVESGFLRYPNVITRLPLQAGENLVRSLYGGPIVLISDDSYPLTAHITIADAVMMPYLKVGVTTMTCLLYTSDAADE